MYNTSVDIFHGLAYYEIPLEELLEINKVISEITMGDEDIFKILDNVIDNSYDEEYEKLVELKKKLIKFSEECI